MVKKDGGTRMARTAEGWTDRKPKREAGIKKKKKMP